MQPLLYYKILNNLRPFRHGLKGVSKNSRETLMLSAKQEIEGTGEPRRTI